MYNIVKIAKVSDQASLKCLCIMLVLENVDPLILDDFCPPEQLFLLKSLKWIENVNHT